MNNGRIDSRTVRKRVASLKPSPENCTLYDRDEPEGIAALAASIKRNGCEVLVITRDNYIVSGHRRRKALVLNCQVWVECRVLDVRRDQMSRDDYTALLRDHNQQRHKTVADQARETLLDVDRDQSYANLRAARVESAVQPEINGIRAVQIEGEKKRWNISEDKADHVRFIKKVVFEDLRDYWPLSGRGIHYPLLNYSFIRGYYWPHRDEPDYGTRRALPYANDQGSYDATCELLTRLRLLGTIPWEAMDDATRPFEPFRAFRNVQEFLHQEMEQLYDGYWRDLLQSQPNHVETVCEKNTVYHMALKVAEKYRLPISSGRGFNSIDPWHDLYERFRSSGKVRLSVIVLSDWDPEGEMIAQVGGRTLRDDFGVEGVTIIKAGVTRKQIEQYQLPPQNFAKETSSNYDWFVSRNGGDTSVYELEALPPARMLEDLDQVIRSVIDIDLFNAEVEREREEVEYLETLRHRTVEALRGITE